MPLALIRWPRRRSIVSSVDAEHGRADRHEGGDQELQQQVACRTGIPDGHGHPRRRG
jgi:hypothetical protein